MTDRMQIGRMSDFFIIFAIMNITIKIIALTLLITTMAIVSSCLKGDDDYFEERTPEMEMTELDTFLSDLENRGFDIDTSDLGIYYIQRAEGEGPLAQAGDTLSLEYTGYLLSGQIFDASAYHYADSTWEFVFKEIQLIEGFDDGIALMNKGSEIDMIIPSEFAYGATGNGPIGPFTTLLFITKLHDINPAPE